MLSSALAQAAPAHDGARRGRSLADCRQVRAHVSGRGLPHSACLPAAQAPRRSCANPPRNSLPAAALPPTLAQAAQSLSQRLDEQHHALLTLLATRGSGQPQQAQQRPPGGRPGRAASLPARAGPAAGRPAVGPARAASQQLPEEAAEVHALAEGEGQEEPVRAVPKAASPSKAGPAPSKAPAGRRIRAFFPAAAGGSGGSAAGAAMQLDIVPNPLFEDGTAKPSLIQKMEAAHQATLAAAQERHLAEVTELKERHAAELQVGPAGCLAVGLFCGAAFSLVLAPRLGRAAAEKGCVQAASCGSSAGVAGLGWTTEQHTK